jgi:hypothetical protein
MTPLTAQLAARRRYPWLAPAIAAIEWHQGDAEAYNPSTGAVTYAGDLTPARVARIAISVVTRVYERGRGRSPKRWRQAREHAVNDILERNWRDGEHYPEHVGLGADATYEALGGDDPSDPPPAGGAGGAGGAGDDDEDDSDNPAIQRARWLMASDANVPPEVRDACTLVPVLRLTWEDRLRGALLAVPVAGSTHRTYARLHRLQACVGPVVLGRVVGYRPSVAVVVDTSGSMQDSLDRIRGTVERIVKAVGYDCDIIQCDTEVRARGRGVSGVARWHGGGGTTIGPGLDAAVASGARMIVCITDGYIEKDLSAPNIPVIWAMTTDLRPYPWGEYVRCEL